jgi:hypothetical protein
LAKKLFKKIKKSLPRACTGVLSKEIIQKKEKIFAESWAPGLSAKKLSKEKKKIFAESQTPRLSVKKLSKKRKKNLCREPGIWALSKEIK